MTTRKPSSLTTINPTGTAKHRGQPGLDLSWIPAEPAALADDIRRLAIQVSEQPGGLRAADRAQLLEYFAAGTRMAILDRLIHEADDPDTAMKLISQMDKTAVLRRQLLKDLTATKASTPAATAAERKASQKSGSQWTGIL